MAALLSRIVDDPSVVATMGEIEVSPNPKKDGLDYATFLLNNTSVHNYERQGAHISELIDLYGDWLRDQLVTQFCQTRALYEPNNLELYADLVDLVHDATFRDRLISESVKIVDEILKEKTVNTKVKDKLRNIGTFLGLLTLVRDIPIPVNVADFKQMLVDAAESGDQPRICLMVVLITHVLKYCERSTIFKKNCTWVARIIEILKNVHNCKEMDVFVCFEIERFLENLNNPRNLLTQRMLTDDQISISELTGSTIEDDEQLMRELDLPPFNPSHVELHEHQFALDEDSRTGCLTPHRPVSELSQRGLPFTPTVSSNVALRQALVELRRPASHYVSPASHTYSPVQRPQHSYQPPFFGPSGLRRDFSSIVSSPRAYYPDDRSSSSQPGRLEDLGNESIMRLIMSRLDFADASIFVYCPSARGFVLENFIKIMNELESKFVDRVGKSIDTYCNQLLFRDLAFCTDEEQIRQCFTMAIRALLLAAFQQKSAVVRVMQQYTQFVQLLFKRIMEQRPVMTVRIPDLQSFVDFNVRVFVPKNQQVVIDCMITLLIRRSEYLADHKSGVLFSSTNRMATAFAEINRRLPEELRRNYGLLSENEMGVYAHYESMAQVFREFIGHESLEQMDVNAASSPFDTFDFASLECSETSEPPKSSTQTTPKAAGTKLCPEQPRPAVPAGSPNSSSSFPPTGGDQWAFQALSSSPVESTGEISEEFITHVQDIFRVWFTALRHEGANREQSCQQIIQSVFRDGFMASAEMMNTFVQSAYVLCQRIGKRMEESGKQSGEEYRTYLFEQMNDCAHAVAIMLRMLAKRQRVEYGLRAALDFVESALEGLVRRVRAHEKEMDGLDEFELGMRYKFIVELFATFGNFDEKNGADAEYTDLFVKAYTNAIYKFNVVESPQLLCCYSALIVQRSFLSALARMQNQNEKVGFLMILVLQVVRLLDGLSRENRLHSLSPSQKRAVYRLFSQLTTDYPEAFACHYIAFSESLPALTLHYRNQVLCCTPPNVVTPSLNVLNFQAFCEFPQMNSDPQMHMAPLTQRLPGYLIEILSSRFETEMVDGFPEQLIKLVHSDQSVDYDRCALSSAIVFMGQMAIKKIRDAGLLINSTTLETNHGQQMLIELVEAMDSSGRHSTLVLIVDHLRFPNSFTAYFSCLILNMFRATNDDPTVREIIARILLERFMPASPFPWGLRAVYNELLRNPIYAFLDQPFHRAWPKVTKLIERVQQILENPNDPVGPAIKVEG